MDAHTPFSRDDQDNECSRSRLIHPPSGLVNPSFQLTSLNLFHDDTKIPTPFMQIRQVLNLLSRYPNLEHLILENVIAAVSDGSTTHHDVRLPRLQSLRLVNYGDAPSCILERLRFPGDTTVDIEVTSPTQPFFASLLIISLGRNFLAHDSCRGSPAVLRALSIRIMDGGIVLKGHHDLPGLETFRNIDSTAQVRIHFAHSQPLANEILEAINLYLPISNVEMLVMANTLVRRVAYNTLSTFFGIIPSLRVSYWAEVVIAPLVQSRDLVINYDYTDGGDLASALIDLSMILHGNNGYFEDIRRALYAARNRGLVYHSFDTCFWAGDN